MSVSFRLEIETRRLRCDGPRRDTLKIQIFAQAAGPRRVGAHCNLELGHAWLGKLFPEREHAEAGVAPLEVEFDSTRADGVPGLSSPCPGLDATPS